MSRYSSGVGGELPPPLAGEGWGGGAVGTELTENPPHPPRKSAAASPRTRGEVKGSEHVVRTVAAARRIDPKAASIHAGLDLDRALTRH
jgi:hypothetical protein